MSGLRTRLKSTPLVISIIKNKKQVDMRLSLLVILTLLYSVLITGCNEAVVDSDPSADGIVRALDDTEKALSKAGNEFSYQIFHELTREVEDENIFISPRSEEHTSELQSRGHI